MTPTLPGVPDYGATSTAVHTVMWNPGDQRPLSAMLCCDSATLELSLFDTSYICVGGLRAAKSSRRKVHNMVVSQVSNLQSDFLLAPSCRNCAAEQIAQRLVEHFPAVCGPSNIIGTVCRGAYISHHLTMADGSPHFNHLWGTGCTKNSPIVITSA